MKINKVLVVFVVIFFLTTVAGVSYFCYDNFFKVDSETKDDTSVEENSTEEKNNKEETLDVDSRLVQSLYNKVGLVDDSSNRYEVYRKSDNILVSEMSDEDKLALVYTNLLSYSFQTLPNENLDQEIITNNSNYNSNYQLLLTSYGHINFIPFSDVELKFKELFGQDATFSKESIIREDSDSLRIYVYNNNLNGYVEYTNVGGIEGRISYKGRVVSAKRSDKNITITEEVTAVPPEGSPTTVGNYVYTFNIDDDGMYSFVSRIKE